MLWRAMNIASGLAVWKFFQLCRRQLGEQVVLYLHLPSPLFLSLPSQGVRGVYTLGLGFPSLDPLGDCCCLQRGGQSLISALFLGPMFALVVSPCRVGSQLMPAMFST